MNSRPYKANSAEPAVVAAGRQELSVLFDGTFDGLLCIVFAYYYEGISPLFIQTEDEYQEALGVETYFVASDPDKAARVYEALRQKASEDSAYTLFRAFLSGEDNKYMDLFNYTVLGFKKGYALDNCLHEDAVLRVHKLAKHVGREVHLLSGFCRFAETGQGVWYSAITPKNNVIGLIAEHFKDRFGNHPWVIHDKVRGLAAVYNGEDYVIDYAPKEANVEYSGNEQGFQQLWKTFFNTIGIKERYNYKLQRQLMPLYFRGNMTEHI